jgi:hypothetical protein
VQLKFDGYRPETRTLVSDVNREIAVNLVKLPGTAKHATAKAGATKPELKTTATAPAVALPAKGEPKSDAKPEPKVDPKVDPKPDDDKKLVAPEL